MFTLNFVTPEDKVGDRIDVSPNHSSTARKLATEYAKSSGLRVQVSRERDGKPAAAYLIAPDGKSVRPLHAKPISEREDCKAPATCFCSPCRAARRA